MADIAGAPTRRSAGEIARARQALLSRHAQVMESAAVSRCVGADAADWRRFGLHWEDLAPEGHAAWDDTHRLRRYGHFSLDRTGALRPAPHPAFAQPGDTGPLPLGDDGHIEPLTDVFAADPLFKALVRMLGRIASCLQDAGVWSVRVHPIRVVASADRTVLPVPEGRHRAGATLVSSLLVGRQNAVGGRHTVYAPDGTRLLTATLHEPGSLLLGDDRATLHEVGAVRPAETTGPARRDVLVTTLTAHRSAERDAQVG
ncbi:MULTISPECIES: 2OG-Fe dioxygenase family protein [Streptomyces]|uniref:2OG-Fe dioxygenase n=1 Tax=Streptomyces qinglanensis TaxID=943816 RepID=A0A1E7K0U8_9ACTN|nr:MULTISPECIES: 2OG-Fe dioxygenase family protein [Streptomyces]OEU97530.1 hypothetical protein AN217_06220 [Streptomyces qinglanensis]